MAFNALLAPRGLFVHLGGVDGVHAVDNERHLFLLGDQLADEAADGRCVAVR